MQIPVDPVTRCQRMCMGCHLKDGLVRSPPISSLLSTPAPLPVPLAGCHVCCVPISCTTFRTRCSTNQSKDIVAAIPKALPQTAPSQLPLPQRSAAQIFDFNFCWPCTVKTNIYRHAENYKCLSQLSFLFIYLIP